MTAPTSTDGRVLGPFEIVVLGAAAIAVVVWAGAALAALAASGSVRGVTVTAAGTALVHLPGHLTDPKTAWPPAAARQLPGPLLYWACQTIVMMIVAGVGVGGWRLVHGRARRPGSALGVAGEAGFAQPRDLRRLAVRTPTPGRVTVGRAGKRLLACEPQASLAAVGPTGSGKTAGFAIPALLEWHGPVLATSVKTDLLEATIEHRRRRGKVWVYDPTGSAGRPAAGWTPLPACATWVGRCRWRRG